MKVYVVTTSSRFRGIFWSLDDAKSYASSNFATEFVKFSKWFCYQRNYWERGDVEIEHAEIQGSPLTALAAQSD